MRIVSAKSSSFDVLVSMSSDAASSDPPRTIMNAPAAMATPTTASLVVGVAIAAGAFMIVLGGSEDAASELIDTNTSKLELFAETMRMFPAYPIFGVGRGAFEST